MRSRLRIAMVAVGVVTAGWCALAIPARATYGARTTADEPQYLLSALSLAEDFDLDIRDELTDRRWEAFHEAPLPEQTEQDADGRRISPHDPLLPAVLAVPVEVGGWVAAKATLAMLTGALAAALVWIAHVRLRLPLRTAVPVVLAFSLSAPFAVYGTQVYPEVPAALAVAVGIGAVTGPLRRRGAWCLAAAAAALPWLSVKYTPVAAALVAVTLVRLWNRGDRRLALGVATGLAAAAVAFAGVHQLVYGGWTAYASGDHFVGGEFTVAGVDPNYGGRSQRLLGLLIDRDFGLIAWAPVWIVALPAVAAVARRRPPGWIALLLPAAAGWLTATFVALTMHGWWWPGRQVVVVLPCLALAACWWAGQVRVARTAIIGLGALSALTWAWVLAQVLRLDLRLVIDFAQTTAPVHRALRPVLPNMAHPGAGDWARYGGWIAVAAGLVVFGWHTLRFPTNQEQEPHEQAHVHPVPPSGRRLDDLVAAGPHRVR